MFVTFLGGCSADGKTPDKETSGKKVSAEVTDEETIQKETETEKETLPPEPETDEFGSTIPTTMPKQKLKRKPVSYAGIDPSKPMIALTFDDGPCANTPRLLDILNKHGVKATFFVVGKYVEDNASTMKRMAKEGHEIASHTWSHANLSTSSRETIEKELKSTSAIVKKITGQTIHLARPPYGSSNELAQQVAAELGLSYILWSVDTRDWESRNATAVYNMTMNYVGNGSIILCHDLHSTTVDAMESVIPALINSGYQFVTVSQLLTYNRGELEAGEIYSNR